MDVGYAHYQISGAALDANKHQSLNQHRNLGGEAVCVVTEILNDKGRLILTLAGERTFEAAERRLEGWLMRLHAL